jgi:hypothetical protein
MESRLGENKRAGQRCGDVGTPDLGHRSGPARDGFEATVVEPGMAILNNQGLNGWYSSQAGATGAMVAGLP